MNGYAASARIVRAEVRSCVSHPRHVLLAAVGALEQSHASRAGTPLAERIEDWRVLWRQTTFFLFDPESWR